MKLPEELFTNGFEECIVEHSPKINEKELKPIREFIKLNFKKRKTLNKKFHSYTMKHVVEEKIGQYVSNGNFIAAMIKEGYKYEICNRSLNCWFYCCNYRG